MRVRITLLMKTPSCALEEINDMHMCVFSRQTSSPSQDSHTCVTTKKHHSNVTLIPMYVHSLVLPLLFFFPVRQRAAENDPTMADAWSNLGTSLSRLDQHEEALAR